MIRRARWSGSVRQQEPVRHTSDEQQLAFEETMTDTPDDDTNPRAHLGANLPPLEERLPLEYEASLALVETIAAAATAAPKTIENEEQHAALVKIVKDELEQVMGLANEKLNLATQPPAVVLMADRKSVV